METIVTGKHCGDCGKWKPLNEFAKDKRRQDGHGTYCIKCSSQRVHKWNVKNKDKRGEYTRRWNEQNPDKVREMRRAYSRTEKSLEKARKWRAENIERVRELVHRWIIAHPESGREKVHTYRARVKGNGGVITAQQELAMFARYGNRCINPDCPDPSKPVTLDHVVPISKGGLNIIENAQPLCQRCNSRKGAKTIDYRP